MKIQIIGQALKQNLIDKNLFTFLKKNNKPASGLFCTMMLPLPKPLHSETMRGFGASPDTKYPVKLWLVIFFQPPYYPSDPQPNTNQVIDFYIVHYLFCPFDLHNHQDLRPQNNPVYSEDY